MSAEKKVRPASLEKLETFTASCWNALTFAALLYAFIFVLVIGLLPGFALVFLPFYGYYQRVFVNNTGWENTEALCHVYAQVWNTVQFQGEDVTRNPYDRVDISSEYDFSRLILFVSIFYNLIWLLTIQLFSNFLYNYCKSKLQWFNIMVMMLSFGCQAALVYFDFLLSAKCQKYIMMITLDNFPFYSCLRVLLIIVLIGYNIRVIIKSANGIFICVNDVSGSAFRYIKSIKIIDFDRAIPACSVRSLFSWKKVRDLIDWLISVRTMTLFYLPVVLGLMSFLIVKDAYYQHAGIEVAGSIDPLAACYIRTRISNLYHWEGEVTMNDFTNNEKIRNDALYKFVHQRALKVQKVLGDDANLIACCYIVLVMVTFLGIAILPRIHYQYPSFNRCVVIPLWLYFASICLTSTYLDDYHLNGLCQDFYKTPTGFQQKCSIILWMLFYYLCCVIGLLEIYFESKCVWLVTLRGSGVYIYARYFESVKKHNLKKFVKSLNKNENLESGYIHENAMKCFETRCEQKQSIYVV